MPSAEPVPIRDIHAARARIAGDAVRTPLVRLAYERIPTPIFLKLETAQPVGSFKLRGASNAIRSAPPERVAEGVWTASAGNMARGVAWMARRLGVPCRVVAPDHAPEVKLSALRALGAEIVLRPFEEWFQVLATGTFPGMRGVFVHPVSDPAVMAGNATIALEVLEELPDAATFLVPYGGGGLSCGIASALRALAPRTRVMGCEVETSAALAAALAAGAPTRIAYQASFVDGIGSPFVLDDMWPLARTLLAGSLVVPLADVAAVIRLLYLRHGVVAEGAGATPVAAALANGRTFGMTVCVVSGGNLDPAKLEVILAGGVP